VKRFENESQTLMEASYEFGVATDAYKIGDNNRAVEYYLRVLQLQQRSTLVMERLGRTYNNLNDFKQAKDFLEKALAIDPSYAPALRTMALCYRYSDTDKALEYLERCFEVNPSDYEALDFLGLIYRDKELYDEAIYYHERALSIRKRPETEFYLSILYAFKGDKRRSKLMALNAEDDLRKEEHEDRLRLAWKLIIRGAAQIIDGNENTALQIIQEAIPYLTTQRIYDEFTTHLKLLLISTNHKAWIPKFMKDLKVKDM
jgi:tetratricopeptide (TPR) repeat protein